MRTKILLLFISVLLSLMTLGQSKSNYDILINEAFQLYQNGEYKKSVKVYEKAFEIKNSYSTNLYNCACAASLAKNKKKAFYWLDRALINNYNDLSHLQTDPDLFYLHPFPEWSDVLKRVKLNEKKIKKESEVASVIIDNIEKNKPEDIYKLFSIENKSTTFEQDFNSKINEINELLRTGNGKLKLFNKSTNVSYSSLTKKKTTYFQAEYIYNTSFFGAIADDHFLKRYGPRVNIYLEKQDEIWQLDSLIFKNNYLSPDFNLKKYINEFIGYSIMCDSKITYIVDKKNIMLSRNEIKDQEISECLSDIKFTHLNLSDFRLNKDDEAIFILSLVTEDKKSKSSNSFDNFFSANKKIYLQFAFFDDGSNKVLVSSGEEYAIYEVTQIKNFKELIAQKFRINPTIIE